MAKELKTGAARKPSDGYNPVLNTRAPAPLIDLIRAKAIERKVTMSAIIREALVRHVESDAA